MKIMIIEDDPIIAEELAKALSQWQFEVFLTEDFNQILTEYRQQAPHLILLDINLPSFNGYYWCQEIRKESQVPIIFISSRSDNMDQIMAMQMGGDDFIQKPFDMPVLVAKVQALLRRAYDFAGQEGEVLQVGDLRLNLAEASPSRGDRQLDLTRTEVLILRRLMQAPMQFVSRDDLINECWQGDDYIDENTLSVNISRLRKKLRDLGLEGALETKRNYGYRIGEADQ